MRIAMYLLLAVLAVSFHATVEAASFDCEKAKSAAEKMICADAELSRLDEEMAGAYKNLLQAENQAEQAKSAQKLWLKERNRCQEVSCLKSAYTSRIAALTSPEQSVAAKAPEYPPFKAKPEIKDGTCLEPKIDWRNYQWILITGNGKTACEEMLAYLKSRPKDQPPPVCAEDRLPPNGNWTRPELQEVSPEQREKFIASLPPHQEKNYKPYLTMNILKTTRTDISGDGIPENLLVMVDNSLDKQCKTSPYCANTNDEEWKGFIDLKGGLAYELLPLNEDGTKIDWQHHTLKHGWYFVTSFMGELIHYKKRPYHLSWLSWDQKFHDQYSRSLSNPNNSYHAIFDMAPLVYSRKVIGQINSFATVASAPFPDTLSISKDDNATCHFGYFHRENLKKNPPPVRR